MQYRSGNRISESKTWLCDRKMANLILSGTIIMAGETIVLLANTIIAGQMMGETAIAAVNLVMPVYSFIGFVALLVSIGTAVRFSQETGKFNSEGACNVFSQGVISAVGLGIIAFAVIMGIKRIILAPAEGMLYTYADEYYSILAFMALEYPVLALLLDTIYSDGGETITSIAYVPLAGGSIVLAIILCPVMGIGGIALGTVIGQTTALLTLTSHFFTKKCTLKFKWHFSIRDFLLSAKYSAADSGAYLCWAVLMAIINSFFLVNFGEDKMPVLTAITSLMEITLIFDGIGAAVQPLIGVYRGENNTAAISHMMKTGEKIAIIEGMAFSVIVVAFPGLVAGMLGIDNPKLMQDAVFAIRIYGISLTTAALLLLISSYNLYMDRIGFVLFNIVMKDFAMPLVCVLLCGKIFGITGVWIGFSAGGFFALMAVVIVTMLIKGRRGFPLYLDRSRGKKQRLMNFKIIKDDGKIIIDGLKKDLESLGAKEEDIEKTTSLIDKTLENTSTDGRKDMYIELLLDGAENEINIIMRDSGKLREPSDMSNGQNFEESIALGMNRLKISIPKQPQ